MDIKKHEFKKIISSPIFIILIIIFLIYNSFLIYEKSYVRNDLKVLNEIVDNVGYEINDDMMVEFKRYYKENLEEADVVINEKTSKKYESINEFFKSDNSINRGGDSVYSKEDIKLFNKVVNIESYYNGIEILDKKYEDIDISEFAKGDLEEGGYSTNVANVVKGNWDEFEVRFNKLLENGDHRNLFFNGLGYKMHSFLFKTIFKTMIYEIMILAVLIMGFIINYEFENKTSLLVYSSKKGREIIKDKLLVGIGTTVLVTTIIFIFTLGLYFIVFDYSGLWGVPISNYFAQEFTTPYMSWWNLSIIEYLILCIITAYIVEVIFSTIAFIIAKVIKNTYIVFGVFAILVGGGLVLPTLIPMSWDMVLPTVFTPFTLIFNPSWWFMQKGALQSFKYYECITLVVWAVGIGLLEIMCIKKFRKENIN
ncbi:ABC transporter permease subunit [Clostridium gasigenes]|uniref:ABC transporter permease subunit n=1 Tax=Clostridium gasigenes TaxID=94869 RepID=UPI001C0C4993|nr:ABC transporter permease subunit [Clostridium gasigenes]MBU3131312.1 ABC transporter permease subunit [Clostridium gasigenes]